MIATLLSVLGLAILFALFGWLSTKEASGKCFGCHGAGAPECGTECPLLKGVAETSTSARG
jgi:hypothetical protein